MPAFLGRLCAVDLSLGVLVGEGSPHLRCPLRGDPVPSFGNVMARVSHLVTLIGKTAALVSHAVTLVGATLTLAFLGLGSHRASLPQWGEVPES